MMNRKQILIAILVVSAALRLIALSSGDTINDETSYAFRSIGMMDFDEAQMQTTPLEWPALNSPKSTPPWWTHLSFHDHPPLVFAVQNISMKIFGENNFGFRLPSAILGVASVYLIYLIGSLLYSTNAGLISAGLMGVTLNHVYISRMGIQEAYVIFFLLLASYLFLKSLNNDKYLIQTGIVLGLAFLTKYTSFIAVPIFLTYLLFFKRDYFLSASWRKRLWLSMLLSAIIFSPVIVYNIMLYKNVGHFDFQFSYIFGQNPDIWKIAPGKEIRSLMDRVNSFIPHLIATNSWLFLSLFTLTLISFLASLIKNFKEILKRHAFLLISFFFLIILLLKIGPSYRFLTMLTPFMALGIGISALRIIDSHYLSKFTLPASYTVRCCLGFTIALLLLFEIFYSVNNQILSYPIGPTPWLSSKVRYENYNWGYNDLDKYLRNELNGKMPAISFDMRYQFLQDIRDKAIEKGLKNNLEPYPALFVYAGNFDKFAKLWVLDRLHIYHAWPIISIDTYFEYLQENGFDYYERIGFKKYYFIVSSNSTLPLKINNLFVGISSEPIYNKRGDKIFKIYKF